MLTADDEALIEESLKNSIPCLTNGLTHDIIPEVQESEERNTMPYSDIGETFSTRQSQFVSLKSKNDKIRFRLLGRSFINGKHFEEIADPDNPGKTKWKITSCSRINDKVECPICNKYFEIMARAKKTENKDIIEKARKEAAPFQVAISVYFPIINRVTAEFQIFQSKLSVKNAMDEELKNGVKVYDVDWIVTRTEQPGSGYYKTSRVDSADTPPLSEEERAEVARYKMADLEKLVTGTPDESELAVAANVEVEPED